MEKPLVLLQYFALVLLLSSSAASSSLPPDALALLAFKSTADLADVLPFNTTTTTTNNRSSNFPPHCFWQGVRCSAKGKVIRLVLEGFDLRGVFGNRTLAGLDQLRILSLKDNSLTGPIPDLSTLSNLKALFLDHNAFVGRFPFSVLSLHRIRTIDLSYNNLSGPVPAGLAKLNRLYCLHLERNSLDGPIPPLEQISLKIFNVSGNQLSGPVPSTLVLMGFDASAFSGNPGLCGKAVRKECRNGDFFNNGSSSAASAMLGPAGQKQGMLLLGDSSRARRRHKRAAMAAGFVAGIVLVVGLLGILILTTRKRLKHRRLIPPEKVSSAAAAAAAEGGEADEMEMGIRESKGYNATVQNISSEGSNELAVAASMSEEKVKKLGKSGCLVFCAGEAPAYTVEQLMKGSAELLGRGTVGTTYKAVLDNGQLVVSVKRVDAGKMGMAGKEAFERHMEIAGRLRHPNLVPLRAYFHAKEERLLVYDYLHNGSLFSLIHGSRSTRAKPLHWTSCLKIGEDVAQGLAYIHQASRLVHGNLKSSNVLLGSDYEACLTDSCLAFLVEPSSSQGEEEQGSAYRAPETRNSNRWLSPKSDIYAFGILLLELLTGKPPMQHQFLLATDLQTWTSSIRDDEGVELERLLMLLDIATACVRSLPESRPTTWQVLKMIQEVKEADLGDVDGTEEIDMDLAAHNSLI